MGRLKPFWPVRCLPTEGAERLPERTAVVGGPLAAPLIGELSAQLTERFFNPYSGRLWRRYSRKASPRSSRRRAYSTVAFKKPSLLPVS